MTPSSNLTLGTAVDWRFAATVGQRRARPGPAASEYTRRRAIDELTTAAAKAEPPVREVTGLVADGAVPPARIVDRPQWIGAAAESMRVMMNGSEKPRGFFTGRVTGAQTGAVLAFVSSGILGQYDPFATNGGAKEGLLLLVYPNVIAVERQLRVDPSDFRLWVCLHEVTHRVQFTANRWLSDYMSESLGLLTQDAGEDIGQVARRLAEYVRSRGDGDGAADGSSSGILGLVRAVQSEPQRQAMDRQGAVAQLRTAVEEFARTHLVADERWCVALSGGPDSLALTAVAAPLRPTTALIVDHGLQAGSAGVAETARGQALALGCVA